MSLVSEKLRQASRLVAESDVDVWLTFVRETAEGSDPILPFLIEGGLTWQSALMIGRDGRRIAVVGNYDADPLIASGDWTRVDGYVQSIREPLLAALEELVSQGGQIAVNFSENDVKADGLTVGMYRLLQKNLDGTRFQNALVSAEPLCMRLRGEKTESELQRMRGAIAAGDRIFEDVESIVSRKLTERDIYHQVHAWIRERGLGFSWDPAGDPIVNSGPDSMIGHGIPSDRITVEHGHIFHIDLGVLSEGYASDIQRVWYVASPSETAVPDDVERAFRAVNDAISAGAAVLKPGVQGVEVDRAARASVVASGYPEYLHAFGHQVGRVAHDGGAILGPAWERYGNTPFVPIRENEVYTLELGITVPGRGYLGLEEMVRVTADGIEWMSTRPTQMPVLQLD